MTDKGILPLAERCSTLERIHLSYCDKITVKAVTALLNRLPLLTHLSLTGISCFKTPELQQFCRPAPDVCNNLTAISSKADCQNFTIHQRASFCVYSGSGVVALRNYLNAQAIGNEVSDESSARRSSASSSSSVVLPGPPVSSTAHSWIGVQDRRFTAEREAALGDVSLRDARQLRSDRPANAAARRDPEMLNLIRDFVGTSMNGQSRVSRRPLANTSEAPSIAEPTADRHPPLSEDPTSSSRGRQSRPDPQP